MNGQIYFYFLIKFGCLKIWLYICLMITMKDNSVSPLTASRKLPAKLRPEQNHIYSFFRDKDKNGDKLTMAQRSAIADRIRKDADEMISYLLND